MYESEIASSPAGLRESLGSLGSDVLFFLCGGRAVGTGRGDVIEPLDDHGNHDDQPEDSQDQNRHHR